MQIPNKQNILQQSLTGVEINFEQLSIQQKISIIQEQIQNTDLDEVAKWIASKLDIPYIKNIEVEDIAQTKIPHKYYTKYECIPIKRTSHPKKIPLITSWPIEDNICKQIQMISGRLPEQYIGNREIILHEIALQIAFESEDPSQETTPTLDIEEGTEAEVVKFVNDTIHRALKSRATDIHIEPLRDRLRIRYRIDGDLQEIRLPPGIHRHTNAITSRIKIMSKLNISERRRPQDGKLTIQNDGERVDVRVSTLPIIYGESISLRLLVQGRDAPVSIRDLDMTEKQRHEVEAALTKPHGIILLTGPTGSGKSTTVSSFLRHISTPNVRLLTAEDPVEYDIAGANQAQVNSEIGLTFAAILRSMLRQDPDIIMLGEIRDSETGDIAVRAAVTGHLVLSTLHTNDAVGSITRLKDIGIQPYMVASALELVCAQRLVRRICPHCARPNPKLNAPEQLEKFRNTFRIKAIPAGTILMEPVGCEHCNGIGYRGRMAVFEVLSMNEQMHEAIVNNAKESDIRELAQRNGMTLLAQDAFVRACQGKTTIDEAYQLLS